MLPVHFSRSGRPLIWGHRGASADAPENTLASFSLALRQDADGVELDAQRCSSGEVVVVHDETLQRTAGFAAPVTQASYSVIRTLDAGAWKAERFKELVARECTVSLVGWSGACICVTSSWQVLEHRG